MTILLEECPANGATIDQVRSHVETLVNDGHLYSTIDDEHFKATA